MMIQPLSSSYGSRRHHLDKVFAIFMLAKIGLNSGKQLNLETIYHKDLTFETLLLCLESNSHLSQIHSNPQ